MYGHAQLATMRLGLDRINTHDSARAAPHLVSCRTICLPGYLPDEACSNPVILVCLKVVKMKQLQYEDCESFK